MLHYINLSTFGQSPYKESVGIIQIAGQVPFPLGNLALTSILPYRKSCGSGKSGDPAQYYPGSESAQSDV